MSALPETTKAYFIKLGEGGAWEPACLGEGTIKFGYHSTPQDPCERAANITLWGPSVIGSEVLDAGLLGWLKERVS